jgi:predicted CoA-binding protein
MGDAPEPPECYNLARAIEQYGVEAITGEKVLSVRLFRDINLVTNVISGYKERQRAQNWATWTTENPEMAEILEQARLEYEHG